MASIHRHKGDEFSNESTVPATGKFGENQMRVAAHKNTPGCTVHNLVSSEISSDADVEINWYVIAM